MLRHALSAIFGDMPNTEYASLLKSVQDNGFTHPKIITYEDKILDGWHRFRVAQHLGKESDLIFEELSGVSPVEFVLAENLHRRHLTASQRGQMVAEANEWAMAGNPEKLTSSNDEVKTREEMAEQANVSTKTIDRAKQVSRLGRSEEVISGEKSASAVIVEERENVVSAEREEWMKRDVAFDDWLGGLSDSDKQKIAGDDYDTVDFSVFEKEFERLSGLKLFDYESDSDVMKNERKSVDDVPESTSEPTPEPKPETAPEPTEGDFLRVVLDSDMVIHDNALAMSVGILRKMPDMSAEGWKVLRRNVLRVIHPDKVDMSEWTDAEKDSWTVLFEFMNDFLGELERDYREYAALK